MRIRKARSAGAGGPHVRRKLGLGPGPSVDVKWLEDRLADLGLDEQATVRFAVRIVDGQIETLFSTDSVLSDSALAAFQDELDRRPLKGVYLVEIADGKVGVVHGI